MEANEIAADGLLVVRNEKRKEKGMTRGEEKEERVKEKKRS